MYTSLIALALTTLPANAQDRVTHTQGCIPGYQSLAKDSEPTRDPYRFASGGNLFFIQSEGSPGNSTDIRKGRYQRALDLIEAAFDSHSDDKIKRDLRLINRRLRHAGVAEINSDELRTELVNANEERLFCPRGKNLFMFRKEIRAAIANLLISRARPADTIAIQMNEDDHTVDASSLGE